MKQWLKGHVSLSVVVPILLLLILAFTNPGMLRVITTLPLLLFAPGFALTLILFKRSDVGIPERLLLSLGLSVMLIALIALILNWTPWGLTRVSLGIVFLGLLVVEVAAIIFNRRRRGNDLIGPYHRPTFSPRQWMLLSLAALVTFTAFYIARTPNAQRGFEGYTMLWIQPSDQPDVIRLGVNSNEFELTKYQIRFELDGAVYAGPTLELEPGDNWEGTLRIPKEPSADKPLKILLYRLDRPTEVYRHAVWWPE